MDIQPKQFLLPFVKKEQVSKDAYTFYFSAKGGESSGWDFLPGQFVRVTLPHANPDERGISRNFSISSSPLDTNFLTITTRVVQSTFKKTLVQLTPGAPVQFFGPVGKFVLDELDIRPHIFLAGGIGITPFHSMISYAHKKQLNIPIILFVSFSTVEEVLFQKELETISSSNTAIKVIYTITHPEGGLWLGETGRISEELIKKHVLDFSSHLFYIAGPPGMVKAMEEIVLAMNVPQDQVKKENFVGY